jgi:hypothetical protein
MATVETSHLDRFLAPLAECLTPEVAVRLLALKVDAATSARIEELAEKANEGELSSTERSEYEDYVDAMDLVGILQCQARALLEKRNGQ